MMRTPNEYEKSLIDKLLVEGIPGVEELRQQWSIATVQEVDKDSSIGIFTIGPPVLVPLPRIPTEASGVNSKGQMVHALLHVRDGRLQELEFFTETGEKVADLPELHTWNIEDVTWLLKYVSGQ